jgi:CBS-domain-containing membrane protein
LLFKEADQDLPTGLIRLQWRLKEESKATGATAGELMTRPAVTIDADATVGGAPRLMQTRRVKRLPGWPARRNRQPGGYAQRL